MVKKILRNSIAFFLFAFSSNSSAVLAFLESCKFKYIRGWGNSVYVGVYKSSESEDRFTRTFKSYCPEVIKI